MREIEFRGKLISSGKWAYGNLEIKKTGTTIITPDETAIGRYGQVDRTTIGQWTGLYDKNGVKIFEGDILKLHYIKNGLEEIIASVVYSEDYAQYVIKDTKYATDDYEPLSDYEDLIVIGNIYDNPELLGKGKSK